MTRHITSRLLSKRTITPEGCWLWTGAKDGNGYGRIKHEGRSAYVHRAAWEHWRGAIPAGLVVDHKCRNRRCFNPDHLEPVPARENIVRGIRSITEQRISAHGKGHAHPPLDRRG